MRLPSKPERQLGAVSEIVLTEPPSTLFFDAKPKGTLRWANFYPLARIIAVGLHNGIYRLHSDVNVGLCEQLQRDPLFTVSTDDGETKLAFKHGDDVVVKINDHSQLKKLLRSTEVGTEGGSAFKKLLSDYERALQEAQKHLIDDRGNVVALVEDCEDNWICQALKSDSQHHNFVMRDKFNLTPHVGGFVDGKDYTVRVYTLSDKPSEHDLSVEDKDHSEILEHHRNRIFETCQRYRDAIELVEARANECGGRAVLELDNKKQTCIPKILGRLHQVREPTKSIAEDLRKQVIDSSHSENGDLCRHIYIQSKGARHYFPEDLADLVKNAEFQPPRDCSLEEMQHLLEKNRKKLEGTLAELNRILTSKNSQGINDGRIFLVGKDGRTVNDDPVLQANFARYFADLVEAVRDSKRWEDDRYCVIKELNSIVKSLKDLSHKDFHSINLDSPRFVELVGRTLLSSSSQIDLGDDVSTPLEAQQFGYVKRNQDGTREFIPMSQDPQIADMREWLFGKEGKEYLSKHSVDIDSCDYITLYRPKTPITFEPHPTGFVKKFDHLEVKESYVIEFGQIGKEPKRFVLEENVWAAARWNERGTKLINKLLDEWSGDDLSGFVKSFKDEQHEIFSALFEAMPGSNVSLASLYDWVNGEKYRMRPFVNGTRSDLIKLDQLDPIRLEPVMTMLGDLMAASIIAQMPHLPRREIIITKGAKNGNFSKMTFLGLGESFCKSSHVETPKQYLKEVVPVLFGNHLAQWLAPIGHQVNSDTSKDRQLSQNILIDICVKQLQDRLEQLTSKKSQKTQNPRQSIIKAMEVIEARHGKEKPEWRPRQLKIETYLPFSKRLLDLLEKKEIAAVCEAISKAAKRELRIIDRLAPLPSHGRATIDELEQVDRCATAISSLIERHVAEAKKYRDAIKTLEPLVDQLHLLSIPERTWYVTLMDVNMRIEELGKIKRLADCFKSALELSANKDQFYTYIIKNAPWLDLPYETICLCYEALAGLKALRSNLDFYEPKCEQLRKALKSLSPLGKIIEP